MVQIIDTIQKKEAKMIQIPKSRPEIEGNPGAERITYEDMKIHPAFNNRIFKKCGIGVNKFGDELTKYKVETKIRRTNEEKDIFLRLANGNPLSVVTSRFREINPVDLSNKITNTLGVEPTIRYFAKNESLQFNYPLNTRMEGLNLAVNTGAYGIYGGSGENAVTYGISWFNDICSNWTLFLDKMLTNNAGKMIHKNGNGLDDKIERLLSLTDEVEEKVEVSKDRYFDPLEMERYFDAYAKKGLNRTITKQISAENPKGMSCYDLSYRLTELCQNEKLSDVSRSKIEYVAGEVIFCYEQIKGKIWNGMNPTEREVSVSYSVPKGPRSPKPKYVDLK